MQPKISIIIPIYNAERFLRQCLDSVLNQPLKELEIICINDGSTDSSPKILEEYAEKDIRFHVISQPNLGYGLALNVGLDAVTGEYIHFLDADDYLTDNAYEETYKIAHAYQLDYLKAKAHPIHYLSDELIGGARADRYALKMMNLEDEDYERPFSFEQAPEKFTTKPVYAPWSGIYRRAFLVENDIRFNSLKGFPDHHFYYAVVVSAKRVMIVDIYMLYYRMNNPESLVGKYAEWFGDHLESFRIICELSQFLPQKAYALVVAAEMRSIFKAYRRAIAASSKRVNIENVRGVMRNFVREFDFSVIADICEIASWYLDLRFKLETSSAYAMLSASEKRKWLRKLEAFPLPLTKIPFGSEIVLYGAGGLGKKTYEVLYATQYCEIIKWVDKNWEVLKGEGVSVSDPASIFDSHFDYVLIAIDNPDIVYEVQSWMSEKGLPSEKIITKTRFL